MARLTAARLEQARDILDRHKSALLATKKLDHKTLEMELKDAWHVGYQELKGPIIDLAKTDEYVLVAARYMETGQPRVVSEFKAPLAKLYGIRSYDAPDREPKRQSFWERSFAGDMDKDEA